MKPQPSPKTTSALDGLTLQEVGDEVGITRERVRQVETKALIKLRKKLSLRNIKRVDHVI